jgi:hypothetical protein
MAIDGVTSKRVRAGLYRVTTASDIYLVENRPAPAEFGGQWLWYVTSETRNLWIDPVWTKAEAIKLIGELK